VNEFDDFLAQLESGAPLPQVSADDLRRVWHLTRTLKAEACQATGKEASSVGIDARLIAGQCQPGADFQAVFFRGSVLQYMVQEGLLDEWTEGDTLKDSVFEVAASFQMKLGDRGFDPEAFIGRLRDL